MDDGAISVGATTHVGFPAGVAIGLVPPSTSVEEMAVAVRWLLIDLCKGRWKEVVCGRPPSVLRCRYSSEFLNFGDQNFAKQLSELEIAFRLPLTAKR